MRGLAGLALVGGDIVEVVAAVRRPRPDHGGAGGEPDVRVPVRAGARLEPASRSGHRRTATIRVRVSIAKVKRRLALACLFLRYRAETVSFVLGTARPARGRLSLVVS